MNDLPVRETCVWIIRQYILMLIPTAQWEKNGKSNALKKHPLWRISLLFILSYPSHQISLQLPVEWKQVHNFWQLGRSGWFFGMSGYRKVVSDADHDGIYNGIGYLMKLCIIWTWKLNLIKNSGPLNDMFDFLSLHLTFQGDVGTNQSFS